MTHFSIITVCFNVENTIKDTLESLYNQTHTDFEYILIDGKSTDDTLEKIKEYEHKFREKSINYRWISETDNGMYDAMNKGISMAKGELIGILNSDDWYEKNALEEVNKEYEKVKKKAIYSGEMQRVKRDKTPYKILYNKKCIERNINKIMPINHPATFVHREIYNSIGLFDTRYKLSADYDFIFRAYNRDTPFVFIDYIIVNMRNSGATGQLKNLWVTANEDQDIRRKNNVKWSNHYYFKRIIYNCLIVIRDTLKRFIKNK